MNAQLAITGALLIVTLICAVGVVYVEHENRRLFVELQDLQERRDELNIDWGRLQLEQAAWAAHGRVENLAREELDMKMPSAQATVILQLGHP